MIEPIRGQLGAYDLSCAACGIVERFEDLRLAPHLFLPKLAAKGWRRLAGRHYCRECQSPVLFASREELQERQDKPSPTRCSGGADAG